MTTTPKPGDLLRLTITQGAVRVNGACVVKAYPDCLLVEVDLASKRAISHGHQGNQTPLIALLADDCTLHLDETQPRDAPTTIEFSDLEGWTIFAVQGPARHIMRLALIAPEK